METLKPQFVPGQSMASSVVVSSCGEEKLTHMQITQENENLKAQVFLLNDLFYFQQSSVMNVNFILELI